MGFVKGTDGIPRTVRNPLEGSVGDIALNDVTVTTLSASTISATGNADITGNVTGGNVVSTASVRGVTVQASGNLTGGNANISNGVFATTGGFGGNVSVGNLSTGGRVFATGNITGGNLISGVTITTITTFDLLPSAITVSGARSMISNANLVASGNFGSVVGNAGSNVVPVYSDGTNWRIG
jgi:hypothetical protein